MAQLTPESEESLVELTIALIEVDSDGALFVRPKSKTEHLYEYIYREANGLRWSREKRALHAYEPSRWESAELMQHIVATLRNAYGENLRITADTAWVGVSPDLKHKLQSVIDQH